MPIFEKVRVSFVNVIEMSENLSGDLCYSVQVLIDKDDKENLARANKAIDAAIAKGKEKLWGGKKPKFRYEPLRDGDAELASEDQTHACYENAFFLNATKSEDNARKFGKPGVVDENCNPVMDAGKIYSGCYCNVDANAYPYKNANSGVGWGLSNIMFCEDGDRLDGQQTAQEAFKNLAPETPEEENEAF